MSLERVRKFVEKGLQLYEEARKDLEISCFNKTVSATYFAVEALANAVFYVKRQKVRGFRGRINLISNILGKELGEKVEELHRTRNDADHYEVLMARKDAEQALKIADEIINRIINYLKSKLPEAFS